MSRTHERLIFACRGIHAAIDRFDHLVGEAMGISRNDLRCLNLLERGSVSTGEVAARLGLTSGTVTALVDRLERAGYVRREPDENDRRAVLVRITPLAFEKLAKLYKGFAGEVIARFDQFQDSEWESAVAAVESLRDGCDSAVEQVFG